MSSMGMSREAAVEYLRERGYRMPDVEPRENVDLFGDARLLQQNAIMGEIPFKEATDDDKPIGTRTALPVATWRLYNQGVPVQPKREEPRADHYFQINPPLLGVEPMSLADALAMAEAERKRHAKQDAIVKDALQRIDARAPDLSRERIVATAMARLNQILNAPKDAAVLRVADEKMAQIEREQQEGIQCGDPPPREGLDMAEVGKRLKALEAETFARINAPIPEEGSRDPAPVRRAPPVSVHAWPAPTED